MEKQVQTIAIIPARGGSKGVPGKNIKVLAGYPLIAYSIVAGIMSETIGRVVVSTDSEEIAGISRQYGAEVPFMRPAQFAGDISPDLEFVNHALTWFKENEGDVPAYLVHLRPTTPLRDPKIIDRAVRELRSDPAATSLRSGHPAAESPFKWFVSDENGYFKGILSGASNDSSNMPRQSFPDVYIPDGYVDVLRTEYVLKAGQLHGDKMIGFISPPCTEVDTMEDFEYLEYELKKKDNPAYDYLINNFKGGK